MANIMRRGEREWNLPTVFDPFRLFLDDFFKNDLPLAETSTYVPEVEVRETKDAFIFKADLPGIDEKDLDISIQNNRLMIGGKREHEERKEDDRYYAYERSFGEFSRSFVMPEGAELDKVTADLHSGVLTINVPKKAESVPKKIPIGMKSEAGELKVKNEPKAA